MAIDVFAPAAQTFIGILCNSTLGVRQQHATVSMTAPWNRDWLRVTPPMFERIVVDFLRSAGVGLESFKAEHQEVVEGPDGEFAMDAVARFRALGGDFVVLVECKHHRSAIKRELVQVLADKVRSVNAQKGMLFSTASFQAGAIAYADQRRIALVHVMPGGPVYETRSFVQQPLPHRPYDAYVVSGSEGGGASYAAVANETVLKRLLETTVDDK